MFILTIIQGDRNEYSEILIRRLFVLTENVLLK